MFPVPFLALHELPLTPYAVVEKGSFASDVLHFRVVAPRGVVWLREIGFDLHTSDPATAVDDLVSSCNVRMGVSVSVSVPVINGRVTIATPVPLRIDAGGAEIWLTCNLQLWEVTPGTTTYLAAMISRPNDVFAEDRFGRALPTANIVLGPQRAGINTGYVQYVLPVYTPRLFVEMDMSYLAPKAVPPLIQDAWVAEWTYTAPDEPHTINQMMVVVEGWGHMAPSCLANLQRVALQWEDRLTGLTYEVVPVNDPWIDGFALFQPLMRVDGEQRFRLAVDTASPSVPRSCMFGVSTEYPVFLATGDSGFIRENIFTTVSDLLSGRRMFR